MRHDYNHRSDWHDMTPQEKSDWMTQDRVFRQALRQNTPTARHLRTQLDRLKRRRAARSESVEVER